MNETKYINAVNTVSQNRIDSATLVSSLNKGDLEQLNIASNQKRITELSNEILDRISSTSPNSANTIRQKIQDGSFIGPNDSNGLYYYITELDAKNIYPFDTLGVVITLDAVDLTTPVDIAHTLLHELAHMRWLYENRLSKLNWNIIQRDKNILNWIVGDDLLTNEMLGYCSEGPGHERGNKENSHVCKVGNLVP